MFCLVRTSLFDSGTLIAANWIVLDLDSGLGGMTGAGLGGEIEDKVVGGKGFCKELDEDKGVSCQLMKDSLVPVGQVYDTPCSHSLM